MKKILSILILSVMLMTTIGMVSAVTYGPVGPNQATCTTDTGGSYTCTTNVKYNDYSSSNSNTYATMEGEEEIQGRWDWSTSGIPTNAIVSNVKVYVEGKEIDPNVDANIQLWSASTDESLTNYQSFPYNNWTVLTFQDSRLTNEVKARILAGQDIKLEVDFEGSDGCNGIKIDYVWLEITYTVPLGQPECGNGILESGEQCDDGNKVNGDGCSSTCQIENPCTLTVTDPFAGQPFDNEVVPIKWNLAGDCQSVVYFNLYYQKPTNGQCNHVGDWFPIITGIGSGIVASPSFPHYSYTWDRPPTSGQYCVYVEVHSSGVKGYSGVFNVDRAPPEVDLSVGTPKVGDCAEEITGNCYINQQTQLTLSCADNIPNEDWQSGVDYIEYRYQVDGGAWTEWKKYGDPFTFPKDSNHVLEYRCFDKVDKVDTESKNLIVDSVGPEFVIKTVGQPQVSGCDEKFPNQKECDYYVNKNTEICVSYEDPTPHPVDDISVDCEATVWETFQSDPKPVKIELDEKGCFKYAEDSYHELHCWAQDALDNRDESEDLYEADVVDTVAPETKLSYTGPEYGQFPKWIDTISRIVLTAEDPQPHPVDKVKTYYRYGQVDDKYCSTRDSFAGLSGEWMTYTGPFGLPESCYAIEYYSVDALGNSEGVKTEFVFSDHTAPNLFKEVGKPSIDCDSLFSDCEEGWDWKVTMDTPIKLSCEDQLPHPSGVKELCYRILWDGELQVQDGLKVIEDGWVCVQDDEATVTFQEECEHTLEFYCVDNVGKKSDIDSEVFKVEGTSFEIPLEKKWNLISVPFNLLTTAVEDVFGDISGKIEGVWAYEDGEWKVYSPTGPSDLDEILPGHGYWVKTKGDTSLLIGGSLLSPGPVLPPSVQLDKGWNLIGRYGTVPKQPAYCALFSLVDTQQGFPRWSALWGYNSQTQSFVPLNQWSITNPGEGYWIETDVEDFYSPSSICYGFHPLV